MSEIIVYDFRGIQVRRRSGDSYFNGQDLATAGGKNPKFARDWVESKRGQEYIAVASRKLKVEISTLVNVVHGGVPSLAGVWMHPKIARRFSQDCLADLAWWVDEVVERQVSGPSGMENAIYQFCGDVRTAIVEMATIIDNHTSSLVEVKCDVKEVKAVQQEHGIILASYGEDISVIKNTMNGRTREFSRNAIAAGVITIRNAPFLSRCPMCMHAVIVNSSGFINCQLHHHMGKGGNDWKIMFPICSGTQGSCHCKVTAKYDMQYSDPSYVDSFRRFQEKLAPMYRMVKHMRGRRR